MRWTRVSSITAVLLLLLGASGLAWTQDDRVRARKEQAELRALVERCAPAFCAIGAGSGVCIRNDGLIVTNDHVAGGREEWAVFFGDGRPALKARRLGVDERGDVCLLKVVGDFTDLPFIPLGDANRLRVGERVMALGNPWVLSQDGMPTVTFGGISCLHYNQGGYSDAIVTDTPVNPGNSGGPLINMRGEVVGINGRIVTRFHGHKINTGVGFAIPSGQIQNFMKTLSGEDLIWHGALLDVRVDSSTDPRGVQVLTVYKSCPAYRSGLRYEDVITRVNGVPVTTEARFEGLLASYPAGSRVVLSVIREKKPRDIEVTLSSVETPLTGIFLKVKSPERPVDPTLILEIDRVLGGSPAEEAGFKAGDVLTHVDGRILETGNQFHHWIRYSHPGKTLWIAVQRGDRSLILPLTLSGRRKPRQDR